MSPRIGLLFRSLGGLGSAVGAGFAIYGVIQATQQLQQLKNTRRDDMLPGERKALEDSIDQLSVNLSLSVASAVLSTGLAAGALGSALSAVATAAGFATAGAAITAAVAPLIATSGPAAAALAALLLAMWIYNGHRTVAEFSNYMDLSGWDTMQLGTLSLIGLTPASLQVEYDFQKLKQRLHELAEIEATAVLDAVPEARVMFRHPGEILEGYLFRQNEASPAWQKHFPLDVDMNEGRYRYRKNGKFENIHPAALTTERETVRRHDAVSVRKKTGYRPDSHLALLSTVGGAPEVVALPKDPWPDKATLMGKFSADSPEKELMSVTLEYDTSHWINVAVGRLSDAHAFPRPVQKHTGIRVNSDKIHAVLKVRLNDDAFDDVLVLLSDEVIALQGGGEAGMKKEKVAFKEVGALLRAAARPGMQISAVNEAEWLTLFATTQGSDSVEIFKYRRQKDGSYHLDSTFTDHRVKTVSTAEDQSFFHDIDQDGLADLVTVKTDEQGRRTLSVARQTPGGKFIPTRDFDFYRQPGSGNAEEYAPVSLPGHRILGFGDSARTLYSLSPDGILHSCTVLSRAEREADLLFVDLTALRNPGESDPDMFFADRKFPGSFLFRLGGGRHKTVTGGKNTDRFLLLDAETSVQTDGYDGSDTLDFSLAWTKKEKSAGVVNQKRLDEICRLLARVKALRNHHFAGDAVTASLQLEKDLGKLSDELLPTEAGVDFNVNHSVYRAFLKIASAHKSIADIHASPRHLMDADIRERLDDRIHQSILDAVNALEIARQRVGGLRSISELAAGVVVDAPEGKAFLRRIDGTRKTTLASFKNVENFTGTPGEDELIGDNGNNLIDGVRGRDLIRAGAGDDILYMAQGNAEGGAGEDSYRLRVDAEVNIHEDYSEGKDSNIWLLNKSIVDIVDIGSDPENNAHLLIRFKGTEAVRLHGFYSNHHATADEASSYHIATQDGFTFSLKTAPVSPTAPTDRIPVRFVGTFTPAELQDPKMSLRVQNEKESATAEITKTTAGKRETHAITLAKCFDLIPDSPIRGEVTGSDQSDRLTGRAGQVLTGLEGTDSYLIQDSENGGVVIINNYSYSPRDRDPAVDLLELPWDVRETALIELEYREGSQTYRSLQLQYRSQPGQHVSILLRGFMEDESCRHLKLRDQISGQVHTLDITSSGVAYLASGSLSMDTESYLEVLAVSQADQVLDGRTRTLPATEGPDKSTVITDRSGQGNQLYGGDRVDELHGGTGLDRMEAGQGNDGYYVQGSAFIRDSGGEDTLVLKGVQGELWFEKTAEADLCIRFSEDRSRKVTVSGYFNPETPDSKVEHIVARNTVLSYDAIEGLVSAMSALPAFSTVSPTGGTAAEQRLSAAMSLWRPWSDTVPARVTP